ncbi:hypothetical protein MAC_02255 [Metarhizium acridum CQMa 102]|uniref:Uncharacterized protein n=1 Tax=Metarhizium acridum (strain CQMa 102) TaxID=655827 RepID=E9DXA7_METAQ|nr:uncharacterized protein MAC_02255 [Metarhizium acridum CQMa 102]EFY91665.1 hypothetical protein MAC_02255 [Metarhizium acridum CQMa 102]
MFVTKETQVDTAPTVSHQSVPMVPNAHLADPSPLAMGGFATTLLSVSLAMMNFRGVSVQTMFVGDLCFVACIGLLISGQWSMVKGDTFSYTVLTAFGTQDASPDVKAWLFYGGYGALMIPSFGVVDAYGGLTPEYYNAFGFFILSENYAQFCESESAADPKDFLFSLGCPQYFLSPSFHQATERRSLPRRTGIMTRIRGCRRRLVRLDSWLAYLGTIARRIIYVASQVAI